MTNFDEVIDRTNTNTCKWDEEGKGALYAMGVADMDFRMPECIRQAMHEKIDQGILSYAADKTYFFEAFAGWQKRHYDLDIDPADVFCGTALMGVYRVILEAYTEKGDGVIVQTPTFSHLHRLPAKNGRVLFDNRLLYNREEGAWSINWEELEEMLQNSVTKLLVICNPGNPVTKPFTYDEMKRMYDLARKNDVIVLSDEIHSDIYFDGRKHTSILHVAEDGEGCVLLTGSGKVFGIPGMKNAITVIHDPKLREIYARTADACRMDVIDLGMVATAAGFNGADDYIEDLRDYLQINKDYLVRFFRENDLKIRLTEPQASYLFWLDFTDWKMNCNELTSLLAKYGIVYSPGYEFGPDNEGFMRMNIATQLSRIEGMCQALKKCYEENIRG